MYDLKKTHLLINGGIISGDTGHALLAEATKGKRSVIFTQQRRIMFHALWETKDQHDFCSLDERA